jgi:hypothetical protein
MQALSERNADTPALLPDDPAGFLDAAMMEDEPRGMASMPCTSMHAPPALMSTTLQPITGFFRSTNIDPALAGPFGRTRWYLLCSRIAVDRDKRCRSKRLQRSRADSGFRSGDLPIHAQSPPIWIPDQSEEPLNDTA